MSTWLSGPALAALVFGVTMSGSASAGSPEAQASSFRVEWSASDPSPNGVRLQGYVYNDSRYRVTNVRLRIVALDDEHRAMTEIFTWVYGDVPAGGRTDFAAPYMPPATAYQVTVVWFDPVAVSGP